MPSARFVTATQALTVSGLARRAGNGTVTAQEIARSVGTDPVVIRRTMPTFVLCHGGAEAHRFVGAAPKRRLLALIEPALAA